MPTQSNNMSNTDTFTLPRSLGKKFEVVGKLGKGAFGLVYEIRDKSTKEVFACKQQQYGARGGVTRAEVIAEVEMQQAMKSDFVVAVVETGEDVAAKRFYSIMPKLDSDLSTLIAGHITRDSYMRESEIWMMCYQIAVALKKFHSTDKHGRRLIHCDIKPQNLLTSGTGEDRRVMVADFGLSHYVKRGQFSTSRSGTEPYLGPEALKGEPHTVETDCFALGVVMYQAAAHRLPFSSQIIREQYRLGITSPEIPTYYSGRLETLIRRLLVCNPGERLTASGVLSFWEVEVHGKCVDVGLREAKLLEEKTEFAAAKERRRERHAARRAEKLTEATSTKNGDGKKRKRR